MAQCSLVSAIPVIQYIKINGFDRLQHQMFFCCFCTFHVIITLCSYSLRALFPSSMYSQADKTLPPMDAEIRARDYDRLNSWCALLSGHDTHVVCINLFLPALTGLKGVSWLVMLKLSQPMVATVWHTIKNLLCSVVCLTQSTVRILNYTELGAGTTLMTDGKNTKV